MTVRYLHAPKEISAAIADAESRKKKVDARLVRMRASVLEDERETTELASFLAHARSLGSLGPAFERSESGTYLARVTALAPREKDADGCRHVTDYELYDSATDLGAKRAARAKKPCALQDATRRCPGCKHPALTIADVSDSSDHVEGTYITVDFHVVCFHCKRARLFGRSGRGRRYRFEVVRGRSRAN